MSDEWVSDEWLAVGGTPLGFAKGVKNLQSPMPFEDSGCAAQYLYGY
jgi:hypothetical protein